MLSYALRTTYPNNAYRAPPITKYVEANGQYKGIFLQVCYDGATNFTNKEFWIEVSSRQTNGSALATTDSSAAVYTAAATALPDSTQPWTGFTEGVTTGPNGFSTWHTRAAYLGGIPIRESGWVTVTPCLAVPTKTIFVNDDFTVVDEGAHRMSTASMTPLGVTVVQSHTLEMAAPFTGTVTTSVEALIFPAYLSVPTAVVLRGITP